MALAEAGPRALLHRVRLAGHLLDHEYTPRGVKWTRLKGADPRRASLLRAAATEAGCEAVLALADVHTMHEAWPADDRRGYRRLRYDEEEDFSEYEVTDLLDSTVSLTHLTGPDGASLQETTLAVADAEACASTPTGDLEPYESQFEGYMGNWGNTLDRWYHRGAIIVWPKGQAFANRAQSSPGWALEEIASIASSGGAAAARDAAATLEPFWSDLNTTLSRGQAIAGFGLGKALHAAEAVADAQVAAMLLTPFKIDHLAGRYVQAFGKACARYGHDWTGKLLSDWFSEERAAWDRATRNQQWIAGSLPGICAGLHDSGLDASAHQLLEVAWPRIQQAAEAGLAVGGPRYQARQLQALGEPLAALLAAATATGARSTLSAISGFFRQQPGDPVAALEIAVLRSAGQPRAGSPGAAPAAAVLCDLAADCITRLRDQLARPQREPGDWSLTLPRGGCTCDLCVTLGEFLAEPGKRTLEWPLAKQRREHVHRRVEGAELPVTHVTRHQGNPHVLVLHKTDDVFAAQEQARGQLSSGLAWLREEWGTVG